MKKVNAALAGLMFTFVAGTSYGSLGISSCVTAKNNEQFCTVDGNLEPNAEVSIYQASSWKAAGVVVGHNKKKAAIVHITESFHRVQPGDFVSREGVGSSSQSIKYSFSKPE